MRKSQLFGVGVVMAAALFGVSTAMACTFQDAQYVPDRGDPRPQKNYYRYTLTGAPHNVLVLNVLDPVQLQAETRMNLYYRPHEDIAPQIAISRKVDIEIQLFDKRLLDVHPYSGEDEAPATIVLHGAMSKFQNLPEEDIDAEYLSPRRVVPGAAVDGRLELIPDTWVFDKCLN